ncbi:recombinase family protein [Luteolibacter sp. SL250]|uniref:recombinase family protein n=1 Tax=Luteolibacter sp. SL250 TaxID=2995170 RepID=UPI0022722AD6|nr:recombinase family protein [Luteolibacter sp. SL250]WAC20906.1 recombinase family protein [Luteolibacter sp. SL250]
MANLPIKRCAIYTRKSSEEGLEQEYNSLDAQRDAGDAFIRSQKHEGWKVLEETYDDGGISGGHLERPGLRRLLNDIEAKKIDVVVVYKVDRLSRSLADFSQLMQLFDKHGVSFVSVTQQFNTSSSMGRLTLNVLLSFAQFEREVTGERIRDKIALSKKKGMWMGGIPLLGYDAVEGKLRINPFEAKTVVACFETYLESGGLIDAITKLNGQGFKTKAYASIKGRILVARPWVAKQLHRVLTQPIYIGMVRHKEEFFEGEHDAIVPQELWEQVQTKLRENQPGFHGIEGHTNEAAIRQTKLVHPLKGFVQTVEGFALTPTYTNKSSSRSDGSRTRTRYRYYVSQQSIRQGYQASSIKTLNAEGLEGAVKQMLVQALPKLLPLVSQSELTKEQVRHRLESYAAMLAETRSSFELARAIHLLVPRIVVGDEEIRIYLTEHSVVRLINHVAEPMLPPSPRESLVIGIEFGPSEALITAIVDLRCRRGRGQIVDGQTGKIVSAARTEPKPALIQAVVQAEFWRQKLREEPSKSLGEILKPYGLKEDYVRRLLRAAYLAPEIKTAIFQGTQPPGLQVQDLTAAVSSDWGIQKQQLAFQ